MGTDTNDTNDTSTDYGTVTVIRTGPLETTPFEQGIIKAFKEPEKTLRKAMEEGKIATEQTQEEKKDYLKYLAASTKRATESKQEQELAQKYQTEVENKEKFKKNIEKYREDASTRNTGKGGRRRHKKSRKTMKKSRKHRKKSYRRRR
jgi:hypothetical protein